MKNFPKNLITTDQELNLVINFEELSIWLKLEAQMNIVNVAKKGASQIDEAVEDFITDMFDVAESSDNVAIQIIANDGLVGLSKRATEHCNNWILNN